MTICNTKLDRIKAMQTQEDSETACNYFQRNNNNVVDEESRKCMVVWCQQAQKALELNPKVVWVAVSLADRYLDSEEGNKIQENRHQYQLVFITAFYVAVKIHNKNAAKIHHKLEWTAGSLQHARCHAYGFCEAHFESIITW